MEIEVALESTNIAPAELKVRLENSSATTLKAVALRIDGGSGSYRGVEPGVLIAVIGIGGYAVKEFLQGLFTVAKEAKAQKIVLQWRDGEKLEVPASTPLSQIDSLIARIDSRGLKKIQLD